MQASPFSDRTYLFELLPYSLSKAPAMPNFALLNLLRASYRRLAVAT